MTPEERLVFDALVGRDPRRATLYHNSPEFKAGVNLLARTIPRFMDLMADEARESEARRHDAIEQLKTMAPRAWTW